MIFNVEISIYLVFYVCISFHEFKNIVWEGSYVIEQLRTPVLGNGSGDMKEGLFCFTWGAGTQGYK